MKCHTQVFWNKLVEEKNREIEKLQRALKQYWAQDSEKAGEGKLPTWFNCEVISFGVNSIEEINKGLIKRDLDAADIITITVVRSLDYWYEVFCRAARERL